MELDFAMENNPVVTLNGEALGGVREASVTKKTTVENIETYLTDVPAARIERTSYEISLTIEGGESSAFEGGDPESLGFCRCCGADVIFEDCVVNSVKTSLLPSGAAVHKVSVTAYQRRISDE